MEDLQLGLLKVFAAYGCKCELFQNNGLQQILVMLVDVSKPAASTLNDSINNLNSLQKQTHRDIKNHPKSKMQLIKFNCILLYLNKSKKQIQGWEEVVKGGSSLEKETVYYSRSQNK